MNARTRLHVPASFSESLVARSGPEARRWLKTLPARAESLLPRWSCTIDGPTMHGRTSVVVPVARADGSPAVLKLGFAPWCSASEPVALHAWNGRGAVRLLERDDTEAAMLLERLRPLTSPEPDPFTTAGRIVRLLAVPAPPGLPTLADKIQGWIPELRAGTIQPPAPALAPAITTALRHAHQLAAEQPQLLVHGDLHLGNVMLGDGGPKAIDPHGLVGDPAYDFLQLLRDDWNGIVSDPNLDRAIERRVDAFAAAAKLDPGRVRRWAQLRSTITAIWLRNVCAGQRALEIADRIASCLTRTITS